MFSIFFFQFSLPPVQYPSSFMQPYSDDRSPPHLLLLLVLYQHYPVAYHHTCNTGNPILTNSCITPVNSAIVSRSCPPAPHHHHLLHHCAHVLADAFSKLPHHRSTTVIQSKRLHLLGCRRNVSRKFNSTHCVITLLDAVQYTTCFVSVNRFFSRNHQT